MLFNVAMASRRWRYVIVDVVVTSKVYEAVKAASRGDFHHLGVTP
jgi:hypothetical protein